jgi:hypothetical protein
MARKKKAPANTKTRKKTNDGGDFRTTQIKLLHIARKLGTSVEELMESYGDAQTIIEKFDSGPLTLLTEDEE